MTIPMGLNTINSVGIWWRNWNCIESVQRSRPTSFSISIRTRHQPPGSARPEHPHGAQALPPGPRSLPVAHLPHLFASCSAAALLAAGVPPVWSAPGQSQRQEYSQRLPPQGAAGVEEDQDGLAGFELRDGQGRPDPVSLDTGHHAAQPSPTNKLISPFPGPLSGPSRRWRGLVWTCRASNFSKRPERVNRWFSTGLCESREVSTRFRVHSPARFFALSGTLPARFFALSGTPYR